MISYTGKLCFVSGEQKEMLKLKGKTALVTGGTKGIGRAICSALSQKGCDIITFGRSDEGIEEFKEFFKLAHSKWDVFKVDAENGIELCNFVSEIKNYKIDILINNIGGGGTWTNGYMEAIEKNYGLMVYFTEKYIGKMKESGWGRVITISSIYGKEAGGNPYFNAAKAAQIAYMKTISRDEEYVGDGITFNTICPGNIACGNSYSLNSQELKLIEENLPLGRVGKPYEVGNVARFLCSNDASLVNGAVITVDGGQSVGF